MDRKIKMFVQKAQELVKSRGNSAIWQFKKWRAKEWDVELREGTDEIRDLEEIIDKAINFNWDVDCCAMCYLQFYDCRLKEPLKEVLNTQLTIIENITKFDLDAYPQNWLKILKEPLKEVLNAQLRIIENITKFDLDAYSQNWLEILLEYFCGIALLMRYFYGVMPDENQILIFKNIFPALWKKEKENEEEIDEFDEEEEEEEEGEEIDEFDIIGFNRDYYLAMEMIFDFLNKDYENVIRLFENSGADLLKFENVNRTVMKLCVHLSKICNNLKDEEALFAADATMGLVQYQHYLWLANDERSAKINLPEVMLLTYLHGDIRGLNEEEMHKSLQPKQVMLNLLSLESKSC
jgi:hypothetical protein